MLASRLPPRGTIWDYKLSGNLFLVTDPLTYRYDQQRYQSRLNGFIEESWNENGHQMLDRPPEGW